MNRNSCFKKYHLPGKSPGFKKSAMILAAAVMLSACAVPEIEDDEPELAYEAGTIVMGTADENSKLHQAGRAVAEVINNTVPGIHVAVEPSKGTMINAVNVSEGDMELAMISGDVAYDAVYGEYSFADGKLENLCVLAACYQEVSGWAALKESGFTEVNELKGKVISSGPKASETELASKDVFAVLGIDGSNTDIYSDSLSASASHVKKGSADAAHAFFCVPFEAHQTLAAEAETVFLSYTDEELEKIVGSDARYFKTEIPAGTYNGQDEAVPVFGRKVLLCASREMDEDLAYEIARAMDLNGPVYTSDYQFMSAVQDKDFLCNELPIPLHEGAAKYYRELGYLKE